jgi:hypothetical protein
MKIHRHPFVALVLVWLAVSLSTGPASAFVGDASRGRCCRDACTRRTARRTMNGRGGERYRP